MRRDPGSFRDPGAYIFSDGQKIIRAVMPAADQVFAATYDSGVLDRLAQKELMVSCHRIATDVELLSAYTGPRGERAAAIYEHPRIEFISYPYEWCFSQLKDAALAHLDLQLSALDEGFVLIDASAYNMQFIHSKPVHIDASSLRPYVEGQAWDGYNQFCRQFLLPLAIEAWTGVAYQSMYRGSISGIGFEDALKVLPAHKLFTSLGGLMHIYLHGRAVTGGSATMKASGAKSNGLPKKNYRALLSDVRSFIAGLTSFKRSPSFWKEYALRNSYSDDMRERKLSFVRDWAAAVKPSTLLDLGGNTGEFSAAAISSGGVRSSVVIDGDLDAVEAGYRENRANGRPILPLLMNLADPTPDMGWRQSERKGLNARASFEGMLALAVIHHMVITSNLPLAEVVSWFIELAPNGIIEFIPKQDPMVIEMLMNREDVFSDYYEANFRRLVLERAFIVAEHRFESNGRLLVAYERRT